jgi:hypothetical protein
MRPPREVRVEVTHVPATPEEERRLWNAIDEFLEAFVRDHVARLRKDAGTSQTPNAVTDPTSPSLARQE